jgi:hypothetical protein
MLLALAQQARQATPQHHLSQQAPQLLNTLLLQVAVEQDMDREVVELVVAVAAVAIEPHQVLPFLLA